MKTLQIYIVDDEKIMRVSLADDLRDAGYQVKDFGNPERAFESIKKFPVDVVITDVKMPKMDGIDLLSKIKSVKPNTEVIVMTAFSSVDSAIKAMKNGAYDYITKPFQLDEILLLLERIKEFRSIRQENIQLRSHLESKYDFNVFVGNGQAVKQTLELVKTVLNKNTTVLITGETGTGKELLANIIYFNGNRRHKPLIKISCAVLSRDIFESELFGHERGAFTGASKERIGRFELADEGTIYLDDVEDIPLDLQVKLLRVLQEQEFERVGSNETIKVDVRVIASTKIDLKELVKEGRFREDLYYRLNVFPIHLSPLRERREDIPELIDHFAKLLTPTLDFAIDSEALNSLQAYNWPGNIRELKNIIERLILLAQGNPIDITKIPLEIIQHKTTLSDYHPGLKPLDELVAEFEQNVIQQALQRAYGNQTKAAKLLGIPPSTLRTKINKYGLHIENK